MALLPILNPLLPDPPVRILALGWRASGESLAEVRGEVYDLETSHEIGGAPNGFDAALWHDVRPREAACEAVERLRRHLRDDGDLIVIARLEEGERTATRQRGSLPSRHQKRLREVVRCLSESGFAIRKDRAEGGWKILVARKDPFTIRPYKEGDEGAILRLFKSCFHVERGLEHWRWKYSANPYGSCKISLGLAPGGRLAAHYGGYPVPFWRLDEHGQRTFLGLQMGDTMTDPAFRDTGRGKSSLLARTVRHFFSIHRDGSSGLYFGFNTGPIQRFCRWFIGGSQTFPVRYLTRDLAIPGGGSSSGYRVEKITAVGAAWDRLFRRVAPSYGFLVQRDARYLDWRYLRCPDRPFVFLAARRWGRLVGWSVFCRRDERIVWGDALFDPRHTAAARPILAAAATAPELSGANRITAWFPRHPSWWNDRLEELGFAETPEPEGLGMVALPDAEREAFENLANLYYTLGDGDLF